jgi:CubicO group peptidase (beta-lactamase class C family)
MKIFFSLLIIILLQLNYVCYAEDVATGYVTQDFDISTAASKFISTHRDTSAVYGFKKGDKATVKGSCGYFSKQKQTKLDPDQSMPIASGTKNIIAAAILKLEEEGKLSTSDAIDKFFPPNSAVWKAPKDDGNRFPAWASQVTIHHLLTHSSGIAEYIFELKMDTSKGHAWVNKQILHYASSKELEFSPGTQSKYCNTGYVMLGMIIEHVTKKKLGNYLEKTFFKPLGMKNTYMASLQEVIDFKNGKIESFPEPHFAHYIKDGFSIERAELALVPVPYADGGIVSTAEDVVKWHYNLHNGKILSDASYKKMITPYFKNAVFNDPNRCAGYGIFISKLNYKDTLYYHPGMGIGLRSESGYVPSRKFGFAVISNLIPSLNKGQFKQIDFKKASNQVDIYFFVRYMLDSMIANDNLNKGEDLSVSALNTAQFKQR